MSLKSLAIAVVLAALAFTPVKTAFAQADGPKAVTIALIDYQRLLRESKGMQDAAKQINAKGKELETVIKNRQKELQAAETELKRQRTVLSPEAFQKRRADFEKDVAEFNRLQKRSADQITGDDQSVHRSETEARGRSPGISGLSGTAGLVRTSDTADHAGSRFHSGRSRHTC